MNKTAYFNHNLMKRRYSVPETIMRKHKLQELLSKKAAASVESKPPSVVKDESCQTDDTNLDRRKKTSKRKRDGLRYFKKSNTYCQYKSYLHKKKYHRETKSGTSATEESTCTSSPLDCHSISSTSLPILVDPKKCSESKSSVSRQVSAPSSSEEFEKLVIKSSETKKSTTSLHPLRQSSLRQLSAPESEDFCKHDHQSSNNKVLHPIRQSSAPSSSDEKHPSRLKVSSDKLFDSSKRVHIKNCKSIDQNTSGYNTICGSLDEYTTPRKKTPENTKISTIEEHHHHQDDRKNKNMYPITFHSESVFLHPCQQGIISHKQFHQISIQMTPEDGHQKQKTEPEPKNDYFKTEIKLNVNDSKDKDTKVQSQSAECCVKDKPSPATTPQPSETPKHAPTRCTTPTVQIIEEAPTPRPEVATEDEPYDCSVPDNYPIKGSENKSNLKIEVDVGNVDIPTNLHDILLRHQKPSTELEAAPLKPKQEGNKYNSKAALNYLFQKLGDSYPRRYLLKQPVFEYKPQFGRYYSELPKPERTEIPSKVLFNNQTYNILSGNLLPNEWSNVNPTIESEHLSDSDISIADSLEDFQQYHHHHQHHQTTKYHNKYNKYDEKLARGDVPAKPSVKPSKNKGVAYFIPLLDSNKTKPIMPAELRKKLCQRNDTLSKHSLCSEPASPVSSKKSPRNKFIHKQIQTCLNSDDSLKKRRKKFADGSLQKNSESQTELDEKIKNILLSGVEDSSPVKENQQRSLQQTFNQSVQTESAGEPVISEYMEMFNVSSPATNSNNNSEFFNNDRLYEIILSEEEVGRVNSNNFYRSFKKCRRIYYPNKISEQRPVQDETRSSHSNSNIPTFSAYQKKLKEFKKQNTPDKLPPPQNHSRVSEMSPELLPLPYPRMKKSREKPKIASKIPGPKRYYQKFEAIPEELSNSSDGGAPLDLQLSGNSDENNESMPGQGSDDDIGQVDENKNLVDEEPVTLDLKQMNNFDRVVNGVDNEKDDNDRGDVMTEQSGMELKSQKGRDSLLVSNEHEELITLSKGWINFYLLKGASTEENSAPEDVEDDSVAHSETIQIPQRPQQYTIHVHATPELLPPPNPNGITSSLPGLCSNSSTKKLQKYEKFNQICPSLPDIPKVSSNQGKNSVICDGRDSQLQSMLPKLHYSSDDDESDTTHRKLQLIANAQSNEPVGLQRPDAAKQENSISTVTTSSNYSESPCEELPGRHVKKFQRYQRPHTYHSTRTTRNQWSLTLKGSNDEKRVNDIEMQLSLKNNPNQYLPSNQSWKLTLKSENTETSQLTRSSRQTVNRGYLPHLNVNYKMLPSPNYHEENITANYSETNSGSNSTLSYGSRKYKLDSELLLQNVTSLNNDLTVQIRHSDDDLTIRGSAITPERKPRVPTMSERDLTRMRLIRQTSADTRLL
ncbi:uncharacterized protein LOC135847837 [Planococcus citri]|uniref:uncharacterized protein LOC135847837 n=1 Tax=Planococcus citri TaxID=170843 RepID=UPI0031F7B2F5